MQIFKTSSIVLFRSALPQGIRAVCVSSALWLYSLVLAFTWFWAYRTPEWAVLVRIGASIFSDLIWIPLGITVWADMALMFVSFSLRLVTLCSSGCTAVNWVRIQKKQSCSLRLLVTMQIGVISAVSIFVLFYHNTAFKLFFIPAALFVIHTVIKLFRAPRLKRKRY